MTRSIRARGGWVAACALTALSPPAVAAVAAVAVDAAQQQLDDAKALFREGRYAEALEIFRTLQALPALRERPQLQWNIARCLEMLERHAAAIEAFKHAQRLYPDPERRRACAAKIKALEGRLADEHSGRISGLAGTPVDATADVEAGRLIERHIDRVDPGDGMDPDGALTGGAGIERDASPWLWATAGLGAASLTAAFIFLADGVDAVDEARTTPSQARYESLAARHARSQTGFHWTLGLGGALLGTSGVLLWFDGAHGVSVLAQPGQIGVQGSW